MLTPTEPVENGKPPANPVRFLRRPPSPTGKLASMDRPVSPLTPTRWLDAALRGAPVDLAQQLIAPVAPFVADPRPPMYELLLRPGNTAEALDPEAVVDLAERTGRGPALDLLVVRAAARFIAATPSTTRFTINLTATGVATPGHAHALLQVLAEHDVPASRVVWEIGEARPLAATASVLANLSAWRAAGVELALDDFGIRCANLHLAARFEFALLKLDRGLTREVFDAPSRTCRRMIAGLSHMARAIGAELVFEGVETDSDLEIACELAEGRSWGQGFGLHRPERVTPQRSHDLCLTTSIGEFHD
jgi:EAL domain-containing protein (putative c-di-GMP-specific phosphodiesterase class I)